MATFQIKFHRYDPHGGESRISGPVFFTNNGGFDAAVTHGRTMLSGMQAADPARKYEIVSVLSHEYRGTDCESGGNLFETRDEFVARVSPATDGE